MAKLCCFSGTYHLLPSHNQFRRNHGVQRCFNTNTPSGSKWKKIDASLNREKESVSETPQILKIAVSGVTELLRLFSPSSNQTSFENQIDDFPASSVDDVLRIIRSDYDNAYFVTECFWYVILILAYMIKRAQIINTHISLTFVGQLGNFTSSIYADNCLFEDPTIKFRGRELYARNLKLLVPFFDGASIILQKIDKDIDSDTNFVLASWKLRSNLKLPWSPLISIDGSTIYELSGDYKIVRHVESWNISAVEAILQIFSFKSENSGG